MKKQNSTKPFIFLTVFLLAAIIALSIFLYIVESQLQDTRKDFVISETQQHYTVEKLEFCVNQAIVPCDDDAIASWNDAHPDKTFTLKGFSELIEEGIEAYNTARTS